MQSKITKVELTDKGYQSMKWSKFFIPTVKETPAEAEIPSHQLMIRAGLIRRVSSGTYAYLPLGMRCLLKIVDIVRQEMDAAGALETLMPSVQPAELWQKTGRDVDYGETLGVFVDRHGRKNVLAPTAEEVMTFIAANEVKSYKQLPFNLYQISFKFRDEYRPRFGVLRSREFLMKDAYSFDADAESLDKSYKAMYDAYCRIFERCGLEYVIVEAETGEMGGSGSHQFTIPCETGEDVIVYTEDNSYAANLEKAEVDPLPAVNYHPEAKERKSTDGLPAFEKVHTPDVGSIESVCEFLQTEPQTLIKTLIYSATDIESDVNDDDGTEVVAVLVRGDHEVNQEKLNQRLRGKHIELADEKVIEQVTGAKVGFAGPVGLSDKVSIMLIDHAVANMACAVTGANESDYHLKGVVPSRDFALQGDNIVITDIRNAVEGDTYKGRKLLFRRGIEVGQVFKLGSKYSKKLGATFLDENGREQVCLMGCYGIGINRIMASAIELNYDDNGICWPINIAPFEVLITVANQNNEEVATAAEEIYNKLHENNIDVLLDDRALRAGVKFKDADLIGIPVRITVGARNLVQNQVEIKLRNESAASLVAINDIVQKVAELIERLRMGN